MGKRPPRGGAGGGGGGGDDEQSPKEGPGEYASQGDHDAVRIRSVRWELHMVLAVSVPGNYGAGIGWLVHRARTVYGPAAGGGSCLGVAVLCCHHLVVRRIHSNSLVLRSQ